MTDTQHLGDPGEIIFKLHERVAAKALLLQACRNVMRDVDVTGSFRVTAATVESVRAAIAKDRELSST